MCLWSEKTTVCRIFNCKRARRTSKLSGLRRSEAFDFALRPIVESSFAPISCGFSQERFRSTDRPLSYDPLAKPCKLIQILLRELVCVTDEEAETWKVTTTSSHARHYAIGTPC